MINIILEQNQQIFYEEPGSEYFRICNPHKISIAYSFLLLTVFKIVKNHLGHLAYKIGSKLYLAFGHSLLTPVLEFSNVRITRLFV